MTLGHGFGSLDRPFGQALRADDREVGAKPQRLRGGPSQRGLDSGNSRFGGANVFVGHAKNANEIPICSASPGRVIFRKKWSARRVLERV
ncbi:MAG: hypothetical protein KDC14_08285, partial [Planctomycetes bacterium]|nr:hypothetical protein [Planctomycetota bacterium]